MRVRVVEARQHGAALRIDHRRLRAAQPPDLAVGADANDLVAAHGDGLGQLGRAVARIDPCIDDDQIDRAIVFALGADNQPGDQGDADDAGHQIGHEAGRHGPNSSTKPAAQMPHTETQNHRNTEKLFSVFLCFGASM